MCAEKFPLVSMGGRAEGLACADPGARTPIGASGNSTMFLVFWITIHRGGNPGDYIELKNKIYQDAFILLYWGLIIKICTLDNGDPRKVMILLFSISTIETNGPDLEKNRTY